MPTFVDFIDHNARTLSTSVTTRDGDKPSELIAQVIPALVASWWEALANFSTSLERVRHFDGSDRRAAFLGHEIAHVGRRVSEDAVGRAAAE